MADYSEEGLGGFPGKWNYPQPGDKPKRLATEEVEDRDFKSHSEERGVEVKDNRPNTWNAEWDYAYDLGVRHGVERERERLRKRIQDLQRDLNS